MKSSVDAWQYNIINSEKYLNHRSGAGCMSNSNHNVSMSYQRLITQKTGYIGLIGNTATINVDVNIGK